MRGCSTSQPLCTNNVHLCEVVLLLCSRFNCVYLYRTSPRNVSTSAGLTLGIENAELRAGAREKGCGRCTADSRDFLRVNPREEANLLVAIREVGDLEGLCRCRRLNAVWANSPSMLLRMAISALRLARSPPRCYTEEIEHTIFASPLSAKVQLCKGVIFKFKNGKRLSSVLPERKLTTRYPHLGKIGREDEEGNTRQIGLRGENCGMGKPAPTPAAQLPAQLVA